MNKPKKPRKKYQRKKYKRKIVRARTVRGFYVRRRKRAVWEVPGVFTPSGEILSGSLKEVCRELDRRDRDAANELG